MQMTDSDAVGVQLLQGDAWQLAKTLPDQSVQCVITSPPYWGLRDYGTAQWEGGDPACDHKPSSTPAQRGLAASTLDGGKATTGHQREGYGATCPRCGARRIDSQFGLEPTPDCGQRGKFRLRRDLTADQIAYVVRRLAAAGVLGVQSDGTSDTE